MPGLKEQIAKAIDPTLGIENSWAAESADRILALPEIAEALEVAGNLRANQEKQRRMLGQ